MRSVLLSCLLTLAAIHVAGAEDESDPPGRVARLSFIDGDVSLAPAGTEEWADAVLNRPLTSGDRLWVDNAARAELQTGSSTIYLNQGTGFSFIDLDDDQMHMSLTDGSVTVRVRRQRDDEHIQIDTPNTTVSLLKPGEYHVEVTEGGATTVVKTRSGESEIAGEHNTWHIPANEEGVFKGTDELTADINPIAPRTEFEDWANGRDGREVSSQSAQYVSNEVIGYEDLDDNGDWVSEPEYGYVWQPRAVAVGWAPYRFGRWAWVAPWGWSWIDDSRWGFAPFHYGRWAYARNRWCWVPGPRHIRPVYAPALVGWVGSPGVGVSVSIGAGVGWFPLGPREVFVPGYRHSPRYIRNVNVSNTVIVNNTYVTNIYNGRGSPRDYRYGRMGNAVTVVQRDQFVGGRPLGGHLTRVEDRDLQRWRQDARPPAVTPDRSSVFAANMATRQPPQRDVRMVQNRRLPDRAAPARVSFDAERRAIEANNGRPVDRSQLFRANPQARAGAGQAAPVAGQAAGQAAGKGPGSVGEASRNAQMRNGPIKPAATQQESQQQSQQAGSPPNTDKREPSVNNSRYRDGQQQNQNERLPPRATNQQSTPQAAPAEQGVGKQLHDRPDWAHSRRDDASRANQNGSNQSGAGSAVPPRPPVESRREENVRPASPQSAQPQVNDTPKHVERDRPVSTPRGDDSPRPQRNYQPAPRPEPRAVERAPQPREQPQPQPHVERAAPVQQPQHQEPPKQQSSPPARPKQPDKADQRPSGNKFRAQQQQP